MSLIRFTQFRLQKSHKTQSNPGEKELLLRVGGIFKSACYFAASLTKIGNKLKDGSSFQLFHLWVWGLLVDFYIQC